MKNLQIIDDEAPIAGPGKSEITLGLLQEHKKLLAESRKKKLMSREQGLITEVENLLIQFSEDFFEDGCRWHILSAAEKEALCEIAAGDCKKWLMKRLSLIGLVNGAVISMGIFLSPVFCLLLVLNVAFWPLLYEDPTTPRPQIKFLRGHKKLPKNFLLEVKSKEEKNES